MSDLRVVLHRADFHTAVRDFAHGALTVYEGKEPVAYGRWYRRESALSGNRWRRWARVWLIGCEWHLDKDIPPGSFGTASCATQARLRADIIAVTRGKLRTKRES